MSSAKSLREWDLLSHFSPEQLARLEACAERRVLPARSTILKEGEPSLDAYLVASGGVRIQRKTPYGLFSLASLAAGQLFGETSFVDGNARSGDAVTLLESELLALSPRDLAAAMEGDQRFSVALYWMFWKSLSAKLRQTNMQLTRFFSETGKPASVRPAEAESFAGDFRVDLASKRQLFQEQKLSSLEINFLSSLSREKKFAPFQQIFHEGEAGHEMYVVLEASAATTSARWR